jgi:hypothetical protein
MLKYRRSIPHLGQKMMYIVMLSILRVSNPAKYEEILKWSHACKKDLFRAARVFRLAELNFTGPSPVISLDFTPLSSAFKKWKKSDQADVVCPELKLVGDHLYSYFDNLSSHSSDLLFKYIGTDHFDIENNIVKRYFNQKRAHDGKEQLTNKQLRTFYSAEKRKVFLFDYFFRGQKEDGQAITEEDEDYVIQYMKKMSAIAFQNAKDTISSFSNSEIPYQRLLYRVYISLQDQASSRQFKVKATGLNPVKECANYSIQREIDPILESTLDSKFGDILKRLGETRTTSLDVVVDYSGSMTGEPHQTALYITLMIHKIFNLENGIVFFSSNAKRVYPGPVNKTWFSLIKTLYRSPSGSTSFESVLPLLENNNNTTLILTDGDCDPDSYGRNPFQSALDRFPNRTFIVWNLKQSKLHFPYSVQDQRVGYLSGNEPSIISAVLRLLSKGTRLTPMSLLCESIQEDELKCPVPIESSLVELTDEQIMKLHQSILRNVPK